MAIANEVPHFRMVIQKISEFKEHSSPEILIHGIPWKIKVKLIEVEQGKFIQPYLFCDNKDKSPNWSLWGAASFKLLPLSAEGTPMEAHLWPLVFDSSGIGQGPNDFIGWSDLSKGEGKKYVESDKIILEINVTAEDQNDPNRSRLNFDWICGNSDMAKFQLKVANVSNLMAVQSPHFNVRGLPWAIQICKTSSSNLGVMLILKELSQVTSEAKVIIKLMSSNQDVEPIWKCYIQQFQHPEKLCAVNVISLDEMENGYVNNDTITLEVEIEMSDPLGDWEEFEPLNATKTPKMDCSICHDQISNQKLDVKLIGHLVCSKCYVRAVCLPSEEGDQLAALRQIYSSDFKADST